MRIGDSKLTVGRWGCTLSSLAMLATAFGKSVTPASVASRAENFTKEGLVWWAKLDVAGIRFLNRYYSRHDLVIQSALKDPAKGVLLQVGNGAHWVLAIRKSWIFNDYVIADPWTGRYGTACGDYGNITGFAVFAKR
jgi:hypothetical protein